MIGLRGMGEGLRVSFAVVQLVSKIPGFKVANLRAVSSEDGATGDTRHLFLELEGTKRRY